MWGYIITEKEMEARRKETDEFLDMVAGKWVGDETTEEIMTKIKEGRKVSEIPEIADDRQGTPSSES